MARDERLLPIPQTVDLKVHTTPDIPSTYSPVYDGDAFAEKRSIREYISVILKRKWMILAIITIVTISTAIYMYRQPSVYQSQTEVLIEARPPRQSDKNVTINLWSDSKYWDTQVKMIQNPELMRDVVIALNLHRNPELFANQSGPGIWGMASGLMTGAKPQTTKNQTLPVLKSDSLTETGTAQLTPEEAKRADDYSRALVGGLAVEPVERTNLVRLKYSSTNPELAVAIPNAVARVFIANDTKRQMQGALNATEDNARQIEELQQTITRLENERINQQKQSGLPLLEGKAQELTATRLSTLDSQRLAANDEANKYYAQYQAAINAVKQGDPYSTLEAQNSVSVQQSREAIRRLSAEIDKRIEEINKQISDLEVKKSQLLVKYTPEWHEVVAIDEQIKKAQQIKENTTREISRKIEDETRKSKREAESELLGSARQRYEAALKRKQQLNDEYSREFARANQEGQAEIKMLTLTQEIETNRKLLDNALQRQKTLELEADASRPDNIKVVTDAKQPSLIGPTRNRNIMIAFLISFAAGIGLAFLLDYLDDSIKSSDDIGRHLGLPTLALIPHSSLDRSGNRARIAASNATNGTASTALVALDDNRSALAEAYRHLRTSLLFSSAGKPPQTMLVTSSQPSEGKTTTAINTAITLAQAGAEVVIVDCDLRRPRLHHHFQLDNTHGLTNFLSGERNTTALLKTVDRLPNLKVITSGPLPPNPAELLSSTEMRNLIEFLRTNFKHVVVDSPPAISFTDAAILSTLVDGVIIVAMAGKSSIHLIRRFKQRLSNIGARIYGVVLNGLKKNSVDYGYGYYGYGYSYYYSYYNDDEETTTETSTNGNGKQA